MVLLCYRASIYEVCTELGMGQKLKNTPNLQTNRTWKTLWRGERGSGYLKIMWIVDVMDGLNFLPYVASLLCYHLHQTVPLAAHWVDFPKLPVLRHDDGVGEVHRDSQRV